METLALDRHRAAIRERMRKAAAIRGNSTSVSWKINREVIVIAGWGRAILLQLAHPLIGAGVADHSAFRGNLVTGVKRLTSTVRAMLSLTFGTDDEAINAAARINCIHDRVSGSLREPTGTLQAGERYSAHDPQLGRWVHATLLESIPLVYEQLIGALTTDERDRYCAEAAVIEPLFGIPEGLLPRNSAELDAYVQEMLASGRLAVSPRSRAIARAILFPPGWRLMWPGFRVLQLMTIGLLPPAIREAYGFTWRPREARALGRWTTALRLLHRATPRILREWPASRRRPSPASPRVHVREGALTEAID